MSFLIINTDYHEFAHWLYAQHPGLGNKLYDDQMQERGNIRIVCLAFQQPIEVSGRDIQGDLLVADQKTESLVHQLEQARFLILSEGM